MSRISRDDLYISVAYAFSKRSTCARRDVGCILVDDKGHVLATGYNGVPSGEPHCKGGDHCPGVGAISGGSLDLCYATHAEQNALLQCSDVSRIHTVYCTSAPCIHCVKLLRNTGCKRVVYSEGYSSCPPHLIEGWEVVQIPINDVLGRMSALEPYVTQYDKTFPDA